MVALGVSVMSLLLVWRHWRNIIKLLTGKESKLGEQAPETGRKRRRRVRRLHNDGSDTPEASHRHTGSK